MRKFVVGIVGIVGILVVVGGASVVFAQEVITIRVADFAPNYFKDEAGNWAGLSVELAEAIVKAAGLTPELVELPWSRAMILLQKGLLHYMTNLSKTEERSEFLDWIGPVRQDNMVLIVKQSNETLPIRTLEDFVPLCKRYGKHFGIQKDIVYTEEFDWKMAHEPDFRACFESVVDVEANLRKTVGNRLLGFFETKLSLSYRIRTDPAYAALAIHPYVLRETPAFHGISKAGVNSETYAKLLQGYEKCLQDGTIQQILEKWEAQ